MGDRPNAALNAKRWRDRHPERRKASARRSYLKNRERLRDAARLKAYGITAEEYAAMLLAQGGRCAICERPERRRRRVDDTPYPLAVDHDHETGAVRALLCATCNSSIGLLEHDADLILRAADYVRGHTAKKETG